MIYYKLVCWKLKQFRQQDKPEGAGTQPAGALRGRSLTTRQLNKVHGPPKIQQVRYNLTGGRGFLNRTSSSIYEKV